jgi:hypothetical protein
LRNARKKRRKKKCKGCAKHIKKNLASSEKKNKIVEMKIKTLILPLTIGLSLTPLTEKSNASQIPSKSWEFEPIRAGIVKNFEEAKKILEAKNRSVQSQTQRLQRDNNLYQREEILYSPDGKKTGTMMRIYPPYQASLIQHHKTRMEIEALQKEIGNFIDEKNPQSLRLKSILKQAGEMYTDLDRRNTLTNHLRNLTESEAKIQKDLLILRQQSNEITQKALMQYNQIRMQPLLVQQKNYENQQANTLSNINKLQKELATITKALQDHTEKTDLRTRSLRTQRERLQSEIWTLSRQRPDPRTHKRINHLNNELRRIDTQIALITNEHARFVSNQQIKQDKINQEIKNLNKYSKDTKNALTKLKKEIQELPARILALEKSKWWPLRDQAASDKIAAEFKRLNEKLNWYRQEIRVTSTQIAQYTQSIEKSYAAINEYSSYAEEILQKSKNIAIPNMPPHPLHRDFTKYGQFIGLLPAGTLTDRNFIDRDRDGIDDRWQKGPGQPSQQYGNHYGNYINLPEGSITDRSFIDMDKDGIDDRWQKGPGQPSYQSSTIKLPPVKIQAQDFRQ